MAKFKKGDRVRCLVDDLSVKAGATGTVTEDHIVPYVKWDSSDMLTEYGITCGPYVSFGLIPILESYIELLTESSSPTPEMGPREGTMEYWRFLFAGQAMQGLLCGQYAIDDVVRWSVRAADALIAELRKGGKP